MRSSTSETVYTAKGQKHETCQCPLTLKWKRSRPCITLQVKVKLSVHLGLWAVSFSSDLVRGVRRAENPRQRRRKRGWQREKKKVSLIFRASFISRLQSRAFRVSRVLLDGLRKKERLAPVVHVHLGNKFLVQSIVNPQVDVSPPQSLFLSRGDICYCSFIHFPYSVWLCFALHQTQVVKPCVVIAWVCFHFLKNTRDTY